MNALKCLWGTSLNHRNLQGEVMDKAGLKRPELVQALKGLERLNSASFTPALLWKHIARQLNGKDQFTVLDIASGGGEVLLGLARRARENGINLTARGIDINPDSVSYANHKAELSGLPVSFETGNALEELPCGFDIIICSLFLHHLEFQDTVRLLKSLNQAARKHIVISDLVRSRKGYLLALAASRILSRSQIVHIDALLSVRAAYSRPEFERALNEASIYGASISDCWPCRVLISWSR